MVKRFSSRGGFVSQISATSPLGLAVDPAGDLDFASGAPSATVQRFTATGAPLAPIAGVGLPAGVGLDPSSGTVWVADVAGTVRGFDPAGALVAEFDGSTAPSGAFSRPVGVAVDGPSHDVYFSDLVGRVVNRLTSTGGFVSALQGTFELPGMPGVDPVTGAVYLPDVAGQVVVFGLGPAIGGTPADRATIYTSGPTQVGRAPVRLHGGGLPARSDRRRPHDRGSGVGDQTRRHGRSGDLERRRPGHAGPTDRPGASAHHGHLAPGSRLEGHAGTWGGVLPIGYAYQWQTCADRTTITCVDIPGATLNN